MDKGITKPKVLLNGSTMHDGGGMQVLINFIADLLSRDSRFDWYFFISKRVKENLDELGIVIPGEKTLVLEKSPANPLSWIRQFFVFKRWENKKNFDLVYSISAPSYFFFKAKEVQRIANAYLANPNEFAFRVLPPATRLMWRIKFLIQKIFLFKSDYFITQTNLVKRRLENQFYSKNKLIEVVPNAVSKSFLTVNEEDSKKEDHIFCIATANWHKNIHQLGEVALLLKKLLPNLDFKFLTTIDKTTKIFKVLQARTRSLDVDKHFIHLGRISQAESKKYYLRSKVTFLPTYLEVFSASIIESIHFGTPVLTTNFDFNRELISDERFLFQPGDWSQAALILSKLLTDPGLRNEMVQSISGGIDSISSEEAFQKTEEILTKMINI
jgi:glycosyltransferase involved in cell wall biosynthesis